MQPHSYSSPAGRYYTSPVDHKINNSSSLALDRQYRYACSAQYEWNEDLTIGFGYEYLDLGDGKLEKSGTLAGELAGKFAPYYVHVVTLNMAWKF
ncbi:MAG: hypothetical protein U9N63_02515 [Pseudomonadota bacterium]|nr:hypothetical protein [Pseudomonadota bacterium]